MLKKLSIVVALAFMLLSNVYAADMNSPVGNWVTISDVTHDRASIVKIWQQNGILYGKVVKIFPGPNRTPNEVCDKCQGDLKNKPVLGMTILWGFTPGNNNWSNGQVLDPHTGNVYKGNISLINNGQQLELQGYWGIFSRTQTWIRATK